MDDGSVWKLNDVKYIQQFRKNLISPYTLQENGASYMSDGYTDIMIVK